MFYNGKLKVTDKMNTGLKVYWFIYNLIVVYACHVSLVYWGVLYDGKKLTLNNVLVHITNSLGLILDVLIIKHHYRISHFIYPFLSGLIYVTFSFIYTKLGGVDVNGNNYVYPILNWNEKPLTALTVGLTSIVFTSILHVIFCGIHLLKKKCCEFFFGKDKCEKDKHAPQLASLC